MKVSILELKMLARGLYHETLPNGDRLPDDMTIEANFPREAESFIRKLRDAGVGRALSLAKEVCRR